MGLLEQQNLLANLLTDKQAREKFQLGNARAAFECEYCKEDLLIISRINSQELDDFAQSLVNKRLHEVGKILPLTRKLLKKDFAVEFNKFAQDFQPISVKKHLEDSLKFAEYLIDKITDEKAADLIYYELAKLKFNTSRRIKIYQKFRYPIRSILEKIAEDESLDNVSKTIIPSFAIWYRIGDKTYHHLY